MAEKSEEQGAAMPANTQKIYAFKDALRKTKCQTTVAQIG